ncbi:PPE domain-containing protein [Crossiella sp. CA-258035]|uniref:PPE domain-containing protein n=1 Tax=Crossiella sp. CA-258035 TaxID=2981138 RepID=UPI0024BD45DB|nr:PPE domain-containing protein [Crossiella sp. CA-258035]WHT20525.1 PPE domain-containing protein [Crossiella sp. CA-258035]
MRGAHGRCWLAVPHLKIYLDLHCGPGVGVTEPAVTTYRQLAEALHRVDENLHNRLAKLRTGWQGAAATGTAEALTPLAGWAAETKVAMDTEAGATQECADAYADARNQVPPPRFFPTKPVTAVAWLPALVDNRIDYEPVEVQVDSAHAEAARAMEVYEERVDTALATLPPLVNPPRLDIEIVAPGSLLSGLSLKNPLGLNASVTVSRAAQPAPQPPHAPVAHPALPDPAPVPLVPQEHPVPRSSTVDRTQVWSVTGDGNPADDHRTQQHNPPRPSMVVRSVPEPRTEKSTVDRKRSETDQEQGGLGLRNGVLGYHPVPRPPLETEEETPAVIGQSPVP